MASPPERLLHEPLCVIRLHHPRAAALDASGAQVHGGRWSSPGGSIVYAALTYAGAILETRVHANTDRPPPREIALITIPPGVRVSEIDAYDLPGWDHDNPIASRLAGDTWIASGRTVALIVPSRAGAPLERNVVISLAHADAKKLRVDSLGAVPWDMRLFGEPAPRARRGLPPRKKK